MKCSSANKHKALQRIFSKLVFIFLLISQIAFGQNSVSVPKNFTVVEGVEYVEKITFYLDSETQTILALQNDIIKWKVEAKNILGKQQATKSKLKCIGIRGKFLEIDYKNRSLRIEIENGNPTFKVKKFQIPI